MPHQHRGGREQQRHRHLGHRVLRVRELRHRHRDLWELHPGRRRQHGNGTPAPFPSGPSLSARVSFRRVDADCCRDSARPRPRRTRPTRARSRTRCAPRPCRPGRRTAAATSRRRSAAPIRTAIRGRDRPCVRLRREDRWSADPLRMWGFSHGSLGDSLCADYGGRDAESEQPCRSFGYVFRRKMTGYLQHNVLLAYVVSVLHPRREQESTRHIAPNFSATAEPLVPAICQTTSRNSIFFS